MWISKNFAGIVPLFLFCLKEAFSFDSSFLNKNTWQRKKIKHFTSHRLVTDYINWLAQPANSCSKLTIETLEQGVKYVQS